MKETEGKVVLGLSVCLCVVVVVLVVRSANNNKTTEKQQKNNKQLHPSTPACPHPKKTRRRHREHSGTVRE